MTMSYAKGIIGLAIVVLAIVHYVAGAESFAESCEKLSRDLDRKSKVGSPKEALELVKRPSGFRKESQGRKMLIRALEAATNDEECSDASLDYLHRIGECFPIKTTKKFFAPSRAYARKCLTPEYANQKVKAASSGNKVDFLTRDFIDKVLEQNPNYKLVLTTPGHIVGTSTSAIVEAINRDFANEGKDPKERLAYGGLSSPVRKYLEENLFAPCDSYLESVGPFMKKFGYAATIFNGETEKLVDTLDQEAKDAIFRYNYCFDAHQNSHIIKQVVAIKLAE